MNEATARIKINTLLEAAGWRFFADGDQPANIQLEPSVTIKASDLDGLGENFENTKKGYIDFLMLDAKGFPLIVLEAKAEEHYTLAKLRKAAAVDRRLTLREILERVFDIIPRFKSKDELLEEEFTKFVTDHTPTRADSVAAIKTYFKAYTTDGYTRDIIDKRQFARLATSPVFSIGDFRAVPERYRALIPEYVKDYVSLNQFV